MSPSPTRLTCEIIFHRATDVPLSDINDLSSDPYIAATLSPLHKVSGSSGPPPTLSYRTQTVRRSLNPNFNAPWIVSGIPASGFLLAISLHDEDPGYKDDRLGRVIITIPDASRHDAAKLNEGWNSGEREYKIHKRHGSLRTRASTFVAKVATRGRVRHRVRVFVSVRVLGPAPCIHDDDGERIYTLGPHVFVRHFSPLIAYLASASSFKANRLQLTGPVPSALRHRYVGYKPFIKNMFRAKGISGLSLNRALHKQHRAIYKWDHATVWGVVAGTKPSETEAEMGMHEKRASGSDAKYESELPDDAFARAFLDVVEYGTEGRIFTYVIMLDGQWRFTETGEEFAINLLSKHSMHADVALEIAYSGEFFVRQLRHHSHRTSHKSVPNGHANGDAAPSHARRSTQDADEEESGLAPAVEEDSDDPSSLPPSAFELVIDNDSGTYRPRKDLLPVLETFLARPSNLGALGRVRAMDGFDEKLKEWKDHRKEEKRRARAAGAKGKMPMVRQASVSSSSSSSISSSSSGGDADAVLAVSEDADAERQKADGNKHEDQVRQALQDDAERAEANQDEDDVAKQEERSAIEKH